MDDSSGKQRKINERSLANLRPFEKGVSGNPSGRPKGSVSLTAMLRRLLEEEDDRTKKQKARIYLEALLLHAVKGNGQAIKEIFARCEDNLSVAEIEEFVTIVIEEINAEFEAEPERATRLVDRIMDRV